VIRAPARVVVAPVDVDVDGVKCTILEVSQHEWLDKKTHYVVSLQCELGGKKTGVFQLDVTSNEELIGKLRVEVAKLKIFRALGYF
jgi:hypothetical protein